MRRRYSIAVCLLSICVILFQANGGVSADMAVRPYPVDSVVNNPPAIADYAEYGSVTLFDLDSISVNDDLTASRISHTAILLTSPDGALGYGSRWIRYDEGYDSVVIETARSILPGGVVVDVPSEQIHMGIVPSDLVENDLYTDSRQVRINYEQLAPGTIVELKYRIVTYRLDVPGFYCSSWLNSSEPSMYAEVVLDFAADAPIYSKSRNTEIEPAEVVTGARVRKTWRIERPALISDEPAQRPYRDRCQIIEHSSFAGWSEFGHVIYTQLWRDELMTPLTDMESAYLSGILTEGLTVRERVSRIFDAVQRDVRYLGLELGVHNLKPHASSHICEKRYGDCKDQTLLMVKLLRASGIEAHPVLVATHESTTVPDMTYAGFGCLDHALALVVVDGRQHWLDPTLSAAPIDWIPWYVQGSIALVLGDSVHVTTIPWNPPSAEMTAIMMDFALDTLGDAHGVVEVKMSGAPSITALKPGFRRMPPQQVRPQVESFFTDHQIEAYEMTGVHNNDSAFGIRVTAERRAVAKRAGDLLILTNSKPTSSAFDETGQNAERKTDLYFGRAFVNTSQVRLRLPDDYRVQFLPEPVSFASPYFDFVSTCSVEGDTVLFREDSLVFKAHSVPVGEFRTYRHLTDSLDRVSRTTVTLTRER